MLSTKQRFGSICVPDLALFQFDRKDLMVPLTTPKFRVYAALGLSDNENLPFELNIKNRPESWWKNTKEFDADQENLTIFCNLQKNNFEP